MSGGDHFERFLTNAAHVRRALVARYGVEMGTEAYADAIAWAWSHRHRLEEMRNPLGYLYRVGQSATRPHRRRRRREQLGEIRDLAVREAPAGRAELQACLDGLSGDQRVAVVLVHGHGASYAEVAEVLGVSVAAVTNHVHRALRRLRACLEVSS